MLKYFYLATSLLLFGVLTYSYFDYLRLVNIEEKFHQEYNELKIKNKVYKVSKYKDLEQLYVKKNEKVFKIVLPKLKKNNFNIFFNWKVILVSIFFFLIIGIVYYFWFLKNKISKS